MAVSHLCRALKERRRALPRSVLGLSPSVVTPCWPKRMVLVLPASLRATTIHDLVGWLGVRFGLLYPLTPARFSRGSGFGAMSSSFASVFGCFFGSRGVWHELFPSLGATPLRGGGCSILGCTQFVTCFLRQIAFACGFGALGGWFP